MVHRPVDDFPFWRLVNGGGNSVIPYGLTGSRKGLRDKAADALISRHRVLQIRRLVLKHVFKASQPDSVPSVSGLVAIFLRLL